MICLGIVENVTNGGNIILRAEITPEINSSVYDEKEHKIGTIKRVFGPVSSPYVSVSLSEKVKAETLLTKKIYMKGDKNHGKKQRRS